MTVKLRYKQPDGDTSSSSRSPCATETGELTPNLGFASAVAEFGMLLRNSEFKGQATWATAQDLARRYPRRRSGRLPRRVRPPVDLAAALDAQNMTSPQSRQVSVHQRRRRSSA